MKTKDEFIANWQDELTGLLLASFAEEKRQGEFAKDGKFFIHQMRRGRDLLARMHADLASMPSPQQPALAAKPANGQPTKPAEQVKR